MCHQWEVGALLRYESNHGDAVLLVVESEPSCCERVLVMWGDGNFTSDVGGVFVWGFSSGRSERIA